MGLAKVVVGVGLLGVALACQGATVPPINDLQGQRGYRSRPCGFDTNRNGLFGEAADCQVCDGHTTDPDADGVAEDLWYVDCQHGVDLAGCGSPTRPCRSLAYAWANADGVGDGAEDIVCFRGRCPARLLSPRGGLPGTYSWPRQGHQSRDFELPAQPSRLVGWDTDDDGDYPPHDPDDQAILEGGVMPEADPAQAEGRAGTYALALGPAQSHLELAHFTVRDYGRFSDQEESGFVLFGQPSQPGGARRADAMFFHDLRLEGINRDRPAQSHRIVFNYFTRGIRLHHLAFWNLDLAEIGGFMVRGSGPERPGLPEEGGNDGPLRWQNLSVTAHGCDDSDPSCRAGGGAAFIGWKLWGYIDGIEVLDSHFEANLAAWQPKTEGNGGALLVNATQCSQDWTIRGNAIRDFKVGLVAQGGNGGYCDYDEKNQPPRRIPRPTDAVVFEDNFFFNTYAPWRLGDVVVHLRGGEDANRSLGNITLRNNILASTDGFDACIWIDVSNGGAQPPLGKILVENNLCWGSRASGRATGIWLGQKKMAAQVQDHVVLRGNVVAGLDANDVALRLDYVPRALAIEGATFDRDGALELLGKRLTWAELEPTLAAQGLAVETRQCEPRFAQPERGDFTRLADDCSQP